MLRPVCFPPWLRGGFFFETEAQWNPAAGTLRRLFSDQKKP
jgi:hypothetical protein